MQSPRKPRKPPTERELELANDWSRTSRLIEESILSRLDFDPKEIKNPKDRYAPLRWLLNDEHVKYMLIQDEPRKAREFRGQRREKYSQLLRHLQADLSASYGDRVGDIERSGCWREYGTVASDFLRAQGCVVLLKTALLLHLFHLPGPKDIASIACNLVKYSALGGISQYRVVPIR